jgi:1,4-alpha-glucan branching enzyme
MILAVSVPLLSRPAPSDSITVHFALHAPGAQTVELLGDFTGWETGRIRLRGPDGSGHWTADVELPAGRHEYIFLVDDRQWVTDPQADVRRPDGFGRENAVMDL